MARFALLSLAALVLLATPADAQKRGGILSSMVTEDPPGFSIHESATVSTVWPMLGWRKEYFVTWPHVKNLVSHNSLYNWGRLQDVWLDR